MSFCIITYMHSDQLYIRIYIDSHMYIYTCIHMYIHTYIHLFIYMYIHIYYTYIYTLTHIMCIYICLCAYVYILYTTKTHDALRVRQQKYMCLYMCVCMYIIYTYTHIYLYTVFCIIHTHLFHTSVVTSAESLCIHLYRSLYNKL